MIKARIIMGPLGRWFSVLALVACVAGFAGCSSPEQARFAPLTDQAAAVADSGRAEDANLDVIRVGEAITISITDLPITTPPIEERVKGDGTITLLQNQTFQAAGKTRRQLEDEIRQRYVPKYYVNMTVSVKQQENTRFYFVGGEVKQPGRQVYLGAMTVLRAIQSCGDFTDYANRRKVQVIRSNGRSELVNASKALKDPRLDPPLYPGDRVHVPRSIW